MKITKQQYEGENGYCTSCRKFELGTVAHFAINLECPSCNNPTLHSLQRLVLDQILTIDEKVENLKAQTLEFDEYTEYGNDVFDNMITSLNSPVMIPINDVSKHLHKNTENYGYGKITELFN